MFLEVEHSRTIRCLFFPFLGSELDVLEHNSLSPGMLGEFVGLLRNLEADFLENRGKLKRSFIGNTFAARLADKPFYWRFWQNQDITELDITEGGILGFVF